jgi:hypothetical protein
MDSTDTRRYLRYYVHTPVQIALPGAQDLIVSGLVTRLSRAGMELYAGINVQPGELMEVEFRTTGKIIRVAGIVKSRTGFCFGLEFCGLQIETPNSVHSLLT